jgi:hypothetical protein
MIMVDTCADCGEQLPYFCGSVQKRGTANVFVCNDCNLTLSDEKFKPTKLLKRSKGE